ncbi:MAG: response regulator [Chloroflexota bacterium]
MSTRLVLADDHALFREGLRILLEARGFEVAGEAGNGIEAIERVRELQPDVLLLDVDMPQMGGLEATRLLTVEQPNVSIVMLTGSDEEKNLFESIKSGAQGYVLKTTAPDILFAQIESAARGEPALTPKLSAKILVEFARLGKMIDDERRQRHTLTRPPVPGPAPSAINEESEMVLSAREREVLECLIRGSTNKEIANSLIVSENTIKYHLKNILQKLHVNNRAQVVAYALRHGLTRQSPDINN